MDAAIPAELLREVRTRHGLSQGALAIRAGVSRSTVVEIEAGQRSPTVEALNDLLQLLGEELVVGSVGRKTGIDLTLNQSNLRPALAALNLNLDLGLLIETKSLSFDTDFGTLDILSEVGGIRGYEELRRGARREVIDGVAVQVASMDHLIAMKRASSQRKDQLMLMEYVALADELRRWEPSPLAQAPASRPAR